MLFRKKLKINVFDIVNVQLFAFFAFLLNLILKLIRTSIFRLNINSDKDQS